MKLDWRLDRAAATLRTTSRQKFTSKDSSPKKLESINCRKFPIASGSPRQLSRTTTNPDAARVSGDSTWEGYPRLGGGPLHSARDNCLQEDGVADISEAARDAVEASGDLWSMSGNLLQRHHVVPRQHLCVPTASSFPIPSEYIDVVRQTKTHLGQSGSEREEWADLWNIGVS